MMQQDAKEREQNTTENKKAGKDWLVRSSPDAYYTVGTKNFTLKCIRLCPYSIKRIGSNQRFL